MAEKRELILDMLAHNKMGPGTAAAARDVDKVGAAADKASKKTDEFGKSTVTAGEGAEKLGKESTELARHVDKAKNEIQLLERELGSLARSFLATDVAAERLDLSKGIRKAQNDIRRLNTSKAILEGLMPKDEEVDKAGKSFIKKLGGALASGGNEIAGFASSKVGLVIGGALGAAAAPVLVSALGSAISAGVGVGVLGAGLALAVSKDKEIQQAGANMGKKFITGLQDSALKSFGGPIRTSIGILGDSADRVAKKWDGAFKALSSSVVPFTRDVVTGVERINESVVNIASTSGPAIAALGDSWLLLSDAVGDALDTLSDGSDEAAGNLVLVTGAIGDVVRQSSNFLGVISELSGHAWLTGPLLPLLKKKYQDAADASNTLKGSTSALAGKMTDAELAARGNADAISALNTELKKQADPVFALREAQIKLKDAQNDSADAVKKHGRNSKEAREATRNLAKAALDLQGNVGALGKDFDGKLTPAMRNTLQAAGLTKRQINDVEKEFGQARKAGNSYAKKYTAAAQVNGASAARKSLYSVRDAANSIPRAVTIAMRITGTKNVSAAAAAVRKNVSTRAAGGPIQKDRPYWVGEEGPELVMPAANGMVLTAAQSRRVAAGRATGMSSGGAGGGGSRELVIRYDITGAETKFKAWFREWIRTGGI